MSEVLTPEIHAAIELQANLLVSFMNKGLPEIEARELAEEAIHQLLLSNVVHPNVKIKYESLLQHQFQQ
jgi:hypothetical protein